MGRKTEHHLLGSSQTSPARPSGRSSINIKVYEDVTMVTSVVRNRDYDVFNFLRVLSCIILKFNFIIFYSKVRGINSDKM
jgi:hypothetical protein